MWQMTVIRCHGRSFYVSPHRRTEEGIQGLWDLAITSASTWLKHFQKYGLLESVAVNGTYTKSDKRWGMISGGDRVVGIHTLLYAHVCVKQRERWTSVPSVPTSDGISAWSFLLRRTVRPDGWRYLYAPRCVRFSARCWITFRLPADYTLMKGYVMEFTGSTEAEII